MITILIIVLLILLLVGPYTGVTYFGPRPAGFGLIGFIILIILILLILQYVRVV